MFPNIFEKSKCYFHPHCPCTDNACCIFPIRKAKLKRVRLQSGREITLCRSDYDEFQRLKLLVDLLLEERRE